jgi:hypothetical protein
MCCVWSKASYVHELVQALARKHRLALYDPQSERVTYPDGSTGGSAKTGGSRSAAWVLGSLALLFAGIRLLGKDGTLQSPQIIYLFAGLCVLMAVACFRQAWR